MKKPWFKEWGWIYRPISLSGWVYFLLAVVFCAKVFLAVSAQASSAGAVFYGVFPYFVSAFLLLGWLASKTSAK